MKTIDDIVFIMNIMLYAKEFDKYKFQELLKEVKEKYHPKIGMLDFEFYNWAKRKEFLKKKIKAVRDSEFDTARLYRENEKLCMAFIYFKAHYKINKSIFHFEDNYFIYLHVGNARNDKWIKEILGK